MHPDTALAWWWLGILTYRRYSTLIEHFGSLDAPQVQLNPVILRELGLRPATIEETLTRMRELDVSRVQEDMRAHGVQVICIDDPAYPALLREIADPPVFLSYKGDLALVHKPLLAIVGTRRMSLYGKQVCGMLVPDIVRSGVVTMSGLARGVDAQVARETMQSGGKTIAVLGHGLATVHPPSHSSLARSILDAGGLLLSEYPLHQPADIYTFPARNRIIAGISMGTLVIEAPQDSGSIITAHLALEYNRDVFAVPGHIGDAHMSGCHALIAAGNAQLVTHAQDVLTGIGMVAPSAEPPGYKPQTEEERMLFDALSGMPQTVDDLVQRTGMTSAVIGATLTLMELANAVRTIGGGQWVRR